MNIGGNEWVGSLPSRSSYMYMYEYVYMYSKYIYYSSRNIGIVGAPIYM